MSLALLLTTATAAAVGAAALHAAHGLRRQVSALRTELAEVNGGGFGVSVPQARSGAAGAGLAPRDEIRTAVAEALAEERERELAEARAFWAAQEARDAADAPSSLGGLTGGDLDAAVEDLAFFMPRQADFAGLEAIDSVEPFDNEHGSPADDPAGLAPFAALSGFGDGTDFDSGLGFGPADEDDDRAGFAHESPELAAARRRHPSNPDAVPLRMPVVADHERTVARLDALADSRTALSDVRPGPLGTLDVYVFADGTTLCMTPGHRETAERLTEALRAGDAPYLLGGSGVSGAYSLTFAFGGDVEGGESEHVYVLADRVIASL